MSVIYSSLGYEEPRWPVLWELSHGAGVHWATGVGGGRGRPRLGSHLSTWHVARDRRVIGLHGKGTEGFLRVNALAWEPLTCGRTRGTISVCVAPFCWCFLQPRVLVSGEQRGHRPAAALAAWLPLGLRGSRACRDGWGGLRAVFWLCWGPSCSFPGDLSTPWSGRAVLGPVRKERVPWVLLGAGSPLGSV